MATVRILTPALSIGIGYDSNQLYCGLYQRQVYSMALELLSSGRFGYGTGIVIYRAEVSSPS